MTTKLIGSTLAVAIMIFFPPEGTLAGIAILIYLWTGKKS